MLFSRTWVIFWASGELKASAKLLRPSAGDGIEDNAFLQQHAKQVSKRSSIEM